MSGEVAVANSCGRRNGTSAPYQRATSAISSLSVEQITRSKTPACCADAIAYASNGCPLSRRTFLGGSLEARAPLRILTKLADRPLRDRGRGGKGRHPGDLVPEEHALRNDANLEPGQGHGLGRGNHRPGSRLHDPGRPFAVCLQEP